jgi:hypothetical protein
MISTQQFIDSLEHELGIIRHLGEKVTQEMLEYRPSAHQRSTLELMQYLSQIFATTVTVAIARDTGAMYMELFNAAPKVTLETFDQIMRDQAAAVRSKISALTEEDFADTFMMYGREQSMALHLLGLLKMAAAYKTQLFLYLKACGVHHIGTMNLWAGIDAPQS